MKKLIIPVSIIILAACAAGGSIDELKKDRKKIESEISALNADLKEIDKKIEDLDTTSKPNYPSVAVANITQEPFAETVTFQGNVEADKNVLVSPQASGTIRGIFVKEGQKISAGKTLASLDSDILNKNVAELEKSLELANYMLEKQENLRKKGVGTEVQYEQAKNQKEALEKKLATLGMQASKSRVSSPITGYVDEIFPNVGEMANPAMPMFRVLNLDKITVVSDIAENYLSTINKGSKVSVYFPSLDLTLDDLAISQTGKFINPANRTFDIRVNINNKDNKILPNLIAEVTVTKRYTDSAIVVPSASVLEDNKGQKYVYILNEGIAKKKLVSVEATEGDNTQISKKSGLKIGTQVIVAGANAIVDGEKVSVRK